MLLSVRGPFTSPFQLHGPGTNPVETAVPIQGCFALANTTAELAASRVLGEVTLLACVLPDGSVWTKPIKGYLVDRDGTDGLVGKVIQHDSEKEAKLFLASLLQEFAAAAALASSKIIVAPYGGGGSQPFQGVESGFNKMADLYLRQIEYLQPTLWAQSGQLGYLVLEEGVALEGFPTTLLLSADRTLR